MTKIKVQVGGEVFDAELDEDAAPQTVRKILDALPIESVVKRWGDEREPAREGLQGRPGLLAGRRGILHILRQNAHERVRRRDYTGQRSQPHRPHRKLRGPQEAPRRRDCAGSRGGLKPLPRAYMWPTQRMMATDKPAAGLLDLLRWSLCRGDKSVPRNLQEKEL